VTYIRAVYLFLLALPELTRLLKSIQDANEKQAQAKKIKEDLGAINEAFKKKDASELNRIFNS
jgi:hypothetical protein